MVAKSNKKIAQGATISSKDFSNIDDNTGDHSSNSSVGLVRLTSINGKGNGDSNSIELNRVASDFDFDNYPTPVSVDLQLLDHLSVPNPQGVGLSLQQQDPHFFNEERDLDTTSPHSFVYGGLNSPEFLSPTSTTIADSFLQGSYMSEQYFSPINPEEAPSSFFDSLSVYSPMDMVNASCALEFQFPGYHSYIAPSDMSSRLQPQHMQSIEEQGQLFEPYGSAPLSDMASGLSRNIEGTNSGNGVSRVTIRGDENSTTSSLDAAYLYPYALGFDMML